MPTKCDECGKESYCIYITREYKNLCPECYDKVRPKREFELDDIPRRMRIY
jgi:hypothetical protein